MCNLEEYKICKADPKEWGKYYAIYRLSNFNKWMPLSFEAECNRYTKVDFCYWVTKDDNRVGGAFVKANMLKCVFTIPPFNDKKTLIKKLSLYVDSVSDKGKEIEIPDADLKSIEYYESLGYKIKEVNKLMVCATNKFNVTFEEQYKRQIAITN